MSPGQRSTALALAVVAIAGGGGFLLSRYLHAPASNLESNVVPVSAGAPAPAQPDTAQAATATPAAAQRVIPDRVPPVTLSGLDGKPRSLADFHQPVLLINFWATWCVPCRREIPLLRKLRRENQKSGVEIVGIAVDFADAVQKYVRDIGLDYPLMIGEEDGLAAAESFGMDLVLPFTVFADADRRIVAVKVGELHADEAELIIGMVRKINAKSVEIAAAKQVIASQMRELAAQRARRASEAPKT